MTKSRSFWSAWGNSEYKRIFELSAGIYGFPYYRKGMDKTRKSSVRAIRRGGFGNVCTFSYQSEKYIRFLSLGRFCSHGIFHNTSSLNFNGLKKLVFFGPARFGAHFLKTVVFGKRPYEKNG